MVMTHKTKDKFQFKWEGPFMIDSLPERSIPLSKIQTATR